MAGDKALWKKGRGKLGVFAPLIGSWRAASYSPMGPVVCTRRFSRILGGSCVQLDAGWDIGGKVYEERAIYAADAEAGIVFWSFTSDGKRSQGRLTEPPDIHREALAFEAEMPAGTARMAYWPNPDGGFFWAVEAKNQRGWNRFTLHHYRQLG